MVSLDFDLPWHDRTARAQMKLLPWSEVGHTAIDPAVKSPDGLKIFYRSNLLWSLETVDGKKLVRAVRDTLTDDPRSAAAVFAHRYDVYQHIRAAGRMFAQCPHCRTGEIEMSLLSLFDTLGVLPPEMFSSDLVYFRPPVSHTFEQPPARPAQFSYATRIRFELPTKILGLPRVGFEGGIFERVNNTKLYRDLMARWETDGVNVPAEQAWYTSRNDAFCATIALISAIVQTVPAGELTLDDIVKLPAVDVYFLDALYVLAFDTGVPEHAVPRPCPHCAKPFVPVSEVVYKY